jgi:serine/threonine-protein kinase
VDGKYHVLRRLACGGMGSVYEARHAVVGRHVALKFLHEQYAQRSCMVQRFLREAQAAGSIASEHIIGVLDYGTTEGTPYLVMELVRGKDLREILAETPRLPVERAVHIILDACRGLALAHERGLVHRDLKPANICVTQRSDGREVAKVIDFGVAKLRDGAELSEEGTLIGTLGYMAPEQLTDQKELDARADIYALGVILYQALAGRPPHICNRSELLYRIVSVDPKPLAELRPDLPPGLAEVVHKALFRKKERRYASVRDFAAALEPFARDDAAPTLSQPEPTVHSRRDANPSSPSAAPLGLGVAETEFGRTPTWAALVPTVNLKARRQCEPMVVSASLAPEQYCRHPDGLPPPPLPPRHHHLSQRALLLSVGALALSVVAMTTMFIFVYSHGSGALEAAAKATRTPSRIAASMAASPEPQAPAPVVPPARTALTPLASHPAGSVAQAEACPAPNHGHPLYPASVLELSDDADPSLSVQQHALEPAYRGARAIDCE